MDPAELVAAVHLTVSRIPPGSVASYGQVAEAAGFPGRARQVGKILSGLPAGSRLPWHRVLRADGSLAFPPGSDGAIAQKHRLEAEGVSFRGRRVVLRRHRWQP